MVRLAPKLRRSSLARRGEKLPGILAIVLLAASPAVSEPRSGYLDASPYTRAMQDDDSTNPAFLWVEQGRSLWVEAPGGPSCGSCHGDPSSLRGVAATYPRFDQQRGRPVTLVQRINFCRTDHQGSSPLPPDSEVMLGLSALVGLQSRGMKLAVQTDGPAATFAEAGRALFNTGMGQLGLSCAQCHDGLAGHHLGGSVIPQGHPNGYPIYRLEWQSLGSFTRRIRNCLAGVRAEPFAPDAPELTALELYMAGRAAGLSVETPGVRP
jgi:sulfur-oxidizing protein SoxA